MNNGYRLFLDEFKQYIKDTFDPYEFEVCATDFWCLLNNKVNWETIYITRPQGDGGIDSIVIPTDYYSNLDKEYYVFQITTGNKNDSLLDDFINCEPSDLYPNIIPKGSKANKIVLALGSASCSDKDIQLITGIRLSELIFNAGTKLNLLVANKFHPEYISNVKHRANLWKYIHSSDKNSPIVKAYLHIINVNHNLIQEERFDLLYDIKQIVDQSVDHILDITTDNEGQRFVTKIEASIKDKKKIKMDDSKRDLILTIGSLIGYTNSEFDVVPTQRYLSIKLPSKDTALAHLDWSYSSPNANYPIFGFKCPYEEASKLSDKVKPKEAVNNYLHYTMSSFIPNPDIYNDKKLIHELLIQSKRHMLGL